MITRYIDFCRRHTRQIFVALLVITVAAGWWASDLGVDSDLRRLLPPSAPSVRGLDVLDESYGGQIGRLTVVLEPKSDTGGRDGEGAVGAETLQAAADELGKRLAGVEGVHRVEVRKPVDFFENHRLLYADYEDLQTVKQRIQRRIRWEKQRANPLFVDLGSGDPPDVDISDLVEKYREIPGADQPYYMADDASLLALFVYPGFPPENLERVKNLVDAVDAKVGAYLADQHPEVSYGLTGRYKKRVDLQSMLIEDLTLAMLVAGVLLAIFLYLFIRSATGVAIVLLPLIAGTVWAMAWARVLFPSLNLITAFIGVVLLGLGVDYGIHLYARVHEREEEDGTLREALVHTLWTSGRANVYAAITTLVALGSVAISDFQGFYEFGLIVVGGLLAILVAYLLLFPVMVIGVRRIGWKLAEPSATRLADRLAARMGRRIPLRPTLPLATGAMAVVVVLTVVGLPRLDFVRDFRVLEAAAAPSWELDTRVNEILGRSQTPAVVLTDSPAQSRRVVEEIKERKETAPTGETIGEVVWIESVLPERQDEKLNILKDIHRAFDELPKRARKGELKEYLEEVERLLAEGPVTSEALPVAIREPFTRKDGSDHTVVLVFPTIDLGHFDKIVDFVGLLKDLPGVDNGTEYDTISSATVLMDIVHYVERDAKWMFTISVLGLFFLAVLAFRRFRDVFLQMGVVAVALSAGFALMGLFGISLNFLNILVLPIMLGLGIDATFHILILEDEHPVEPGPHLATQFAVMGAVMTSMLGLGATLVARHQGLHSLGEAAVVGLGTLMVVNLLFHALLLVSNTRHEDIDRQDEEDTS